MQAKFFDGRLAAVSHARTQAALHLIDDLGDGAAVRDPSFNALGHELLGPLLEVAVAGARRHRRERTHAAVHLEAAALIEFDLTRALLRACEHGADHDGAAACRKGLDDVARILDAAVRDDALAELVGFLRAVHDGGELRHADARDDTRGADGAGADAHFDDVCARFDEGARCACRCDVARNDGHVGEGALDLGDLFDDALAVAVRRIDGDDIHLLFDEGGDALHRIGGSADRRADEKTAVLISCRVGVLDALFDVLDRDEALQVPVFIDDGKLFDAVTAQNLLRIGKRGADGRRDEVFLRHHVFDGLIVVGLKAEIAVGEDADELAVAGDGHAADAVALHEGDRVAHEILRFEEEGIGDDAVFGALDLVHLLGLFLDAHVLMDDAEPPFARHGDGKAALRDGVHCRGDDGKIERKPLAQRGAEVYIVRQDVGRLRDEQNVVKCKSFFDHFTHLLLPPKDRWFPDRSKILPYIASYRK